MEEIAVPSTQSSTTPQNIENVTPNKKKKTSTNQKSGKNPQNDSFSQSKDGENVPAIEKPLPEEAIFLKNNLKIYKEELMSYLLEGLDTVNLTENQEFLEIKKQELAQTNEEAEIKKILENLISPLIDSKPANKLTEVISICKEKANSFSEKFNDWDSQKYFDFILSIADRKNYLDRIKLSIDQDELKKLNLEDKFYLFEIKNLDSLTFYADMIDLANCRKKRGQKKYLIELLNRLISNIEKIRSDEKSELEKAYKSLDLYKKKKEEKIKLLEKKPLISEKKRKPQKENSDSKENVTRNLKRLKIDSDKESFISNNKENMSENDEISKEEEMKIAEEIMKEEEEKEKEKETEKDKNKKSNQKSLFNFFIKKSPKKSEIKQTTIQNTSIPERKSIFRCVGSVQPKINIQDTSTTNQNLSSTSTLDSISLIKEAARNFKKSHQRKYYNPLLRKIHLYFADSLRQYRAVTFDKVSSKVTGRNPLQKDDYINYEYDSDEEIEEQNAIALDLPSDEKEIDEEDDISEEDEKFVVPDGYLSDGEKVDDDGEIEIVKPDLNICNMGNFSSQITKPFIFTFDKYINGKDSNLDEFVENFRVFIICTEDQPIQIKKHKHDNLIPKGDDILNTDEILKELIRLVHGSFEKKPTLITEFNQKFPNCPKASIERKIKELAKKEKIDGENKARYLISKETFERLILNEEYDLLLKNKMEAYLKKENELKSNLETEAIKITTETEIPIINVIEEKSVKKTDGKKLATTNKKKSSHILNSKKKAEKTKLTTPSKGQKEILKFLSSKKKMEKEKVAEE